MNTFIEENVYLVSVIVLTVFIVLYAFVLPYLKKKQALTDTNFNNVETGITLFRLALASVTIDEKFKSQAAVVVNTVETALDYIKKMNTAVSDTDKKAIIMESVDKVLVSNRIYADDNLKKLIEQIVEIAVKI